MTKSNIKNPKFFGRPTATWFMEMCVDNHISDDNTEYSTSELSNLYQKSRSTIRRVILANYEKIYEKKFEPKYIINERGSTEVIFTGNFLKKISRDYINENKYIK